MVATVASKDSAKEAWDAIKMIHIGDDRVRASTAQQLLQHDAGTLQEGESIEDFSMWLSGCNTLKFSNKLIGLHFMACIFLFLSPRSILVFEKIYFPLQNLFIIFSFINLKVFRLKS
jgi:hypothetical protein